MGQTTRGNLPDKEGWLIKQLGEHREVVVHGARHVRTFDQAAHYLVKYHDKPSLTPVAHGNVRSEHRRAR